MLGVTGLEVVDDTNTALYVETLRSERLRIGVLAVVLAAILAIVSAIFAIFNDGIQYFASKPVGPELPVYVIGPFLLYETAVFFLLSRAVAGKLRPPAFARYVNAVVETSLPSVILLVASTYTEPAVIFGGWPSLLYFVFIIAATLRLNFALPLLTGVSSAAGYMAVAAYVLPLSMAASNPVETVLYHLSRAFIMLVAGVVAGLVSLRLRRTLVRVNEQNAARERVTSLFGQHVSPAVVERLLDENSSAEGEVSQICVMFLDIRDFTSFARQRPPREVVDYLNRSFAFMIEAVERHHGIINKFLGDSFMAIFGAPLASADAAAEAVAASREILAEIDARAAAGGQPPRVGIGLHAGPAVTGNIGSPRRKEFTAIGDTVNLAARLEQLNKEHGSRLLVSDAVAKALGPALGPAVLIGSVTVKGYAEPVPAWRLD